jgi:hypothetical protein
MFLLNVAHILIMIKNVNVKCYINYITVWWSLRCNGVVYNSLKERVGELAHAPLAQCVHPFHKFSSCSYLLYLEATKS